MEDMPSHDGTDISRRAFVLGSAAAVLAVPLVAAMGDAAAAPPPLLDGVVRPRAEWAGGLPVPAPLEQEAPGDVRFLIVHHTASTNRYAAGDVPAQIRGFHSFHTGPEKGWPDVAYNFFVDRYGGAWEGRAGSLAGPVMPDATGGSQGFAQICCFIGDHTAEPPTPEAQRSMILLLAGLAERYGVDPAPGATTTFVSRGSNRWPAGASVPTSTIAGHRDMSMTTCPGDAAYPLVKDAFPIEVTAVLAARRPPPAPAGEPPPATPPPAAQEEATSAAATSAGATDAKASAQDDGVDAATMALVAGGAAVVAGLGVVQYARSRSAVMKEASGTGADAPAGTSDGPLDRSPAGEGPST
jgi:hypothetical protein